MPITGRTLEEASATFREHINRVVALTVTPMPLIMFEVPTGIQPAFRQQGAPVEAPLATKFGPVGLYWARRADPPWRTTDGTDSGRSATATR